jgi:hypothetical protein
VGHALSSFPAFFAHHIFYYTGIPKNQHLRPRYRDPSVEHPYPFCPGRESERDRFLSFYSSLGKADLIDCHYPFTALIENKMVLFHIVWVMIMKYSEWLRSRSDYSRHSLIALLGGCGTRFAQTSSPFDSVGFPRRTNREGYIFNGRISHAEYLLFISLRMFTHTMWKRTNKFNRLYLPRLECRIGLERHNSFLSRKIGNRQHLLLGNGVAAV